MLYQCSAGSKSVTPQEVPFVASLPEPEPQTAPTGVPRLFCPSLPKRVPSFRVGDVLNPFSNPKVELATLRDHERDLVSQFVDAVFKEQERSELLNDDFEEWMQKLFEAFFGKTSDKMGVRYKRLKMYNAFISWTHFKNERHDITRRQFANELKELGIENG